MLLAGRHGGPTHAGACDANRLGRTHGAAGTVPPQWQIITARGRHSVRTFAAAGVVGRLGVGGWGLADAGAPAWREVHVELDFADELDLGSWSVGAGPGGHAVDAVGQADGVVVVEDVLDFAVV